MLGNKRESRSSIVVEDNCDKGRKVPRELTSRPLTGPGETNEVASLRTALL